jgi:rhamnosyltransferase
VIILKISVIIPTKNAKAYIKDMLDKLMNQTRKPDEIIIIDTNSKDETQEICKSFEFVKFIHINDGEFGHGKTRNQAASQAIGDILIFMTQDAKPYDECFIEELIKPLDGEVVATYARQLPREDAKPIEKFSRNFNYGNDDIIKTKQDLKNLGVKTFFFSNVASAFIKEKFWEVGGFPTDTIMNEDMIIASKLIFSDKKIKYVSTAKVTHSHTYSYIEQFKRNFDVGVVFADSSEYFYGVKSESEGIKFVKEATKYLINDKKIYLIPHLIIESGFKFIGYKLGMNYKKIPKKYVKKMSMHSFYFENKIGSGK